MLGTFLNHTPFDFLRQILSRDLELIYLVRVAGQSASEVLLSVLSNYPSQCWDYRCLLLHPAFLWVLGTQTLFLMIVWQALYWLNHLPGPHILGIFTAVKSCLLSLLPVWRHLLPMETRLALNLTQSCLCLLSAIYISVPPHPTVLSFLLLIACLAFLVCTFICLEYNLPQLLEERYLGHNC